MPRVVGLGAGGHGRVVVDALRMSGTATLVGWLDADPLRRGSDFVGVPVLGADDLLGDLRARGVDAVFIGLGCAGDMRPRRRLYALARAAGFEVMSIVHPSATVSAFASIGPGVTILAGAIMNAGAALGENVIVNTGAIVEHDCVIGSHCHIATGARLASTVTVGEGSHIGLGACIRECITIGRDVIAGAGAVVVKDVPDGVVVVGSPARVLRHAEAS